MVPGVKINAKAAAQSDGAKLDDGQRADGRASTSRRTGIFLKDQTKDVANPQVVVTDINKGNKQIAHAINRVLLPVLPA